MPRRLFVFATGLIVAAPACGDHDISPDEFCSPSPCTCPDGTSSNTSCIEPYVGQCSCHQDVPLPHDGDDGGGGRGGFVPPSEPTVWASCPFETNTYNGAIALTSSRIVFSCSDVDTTYGPTQGGGPTAIVWAPKPKAGDDLASHLPEVGRTIVKRTSSPASQARPTLDGGYGLAGAVEEGIAITGFYSPTNGHQRETFWYATYEGTMKQLQDGDGGWCIAFGRDPGRCVHAGVGVNFQVEPIPPMAGSSAGKFTANIDDATCTQWVGTLVVKDHVYVGAYCNIGSADAESRIYDVTNDAHFRLVAKSSDSTTPIVSSHFAISGDTLYGALNNTNVGLFSVSVATGAITTKIAPVGPGAYVFAADDKAVYLRDKSDNTANAPLRLRKIPLDGSPAETIAEFATGGAWLELDGDAIYWSDLDDSGRQCVKVRKK
jgi:hypothetical protein